MKISTIFITFYNYIIILLAAIICFPICLLILLLPTKYRYNNRVFFFFMNLFYKIIINLSLLPIKIIGLENIPKDKKVIFAPNHQSSIDIALVGYVCGLRPHIWLVLEYYVNAFVLGFFIKRMFVPVDNQNPIKSARSIVKLLDRLRSNPADLIIFPEAGRFKDGKIHKFYEGFAYIAQKTKFPVIPILMPYNYKVYPPGSFWIYYNDIKVIVGKPFIYSDTDTIESFTSKVHNWFLEELDKL